MSEANENDEVKVACADMSKFNIDKLVADAQDVWIQSGYGMPRKSDHLSIRRRARKTTKDFTNIPDNCCLLSTHV